MTCRQCGAPATDADSGLCPEHFEEQRQAIVGRLKQPKPVAASPARPRERVPLWVALLLVVMTLVTGISVVGIRTTSSSPGLWTLIAMVCSVPTFLLWRYFMRRYPKALWPVGFSLAGLVLVAVMANWAYVFVTTPAQSELVGTRSPREAEQSSRHAWQACMDIAKNRFQSPTGVKAETYPTRFIERQGGVYAVRGRVDAPNAYGVMLPHMVYCNVTPTQDPNSLYGWSVLDVDLVPL
ncbi:hypothetical protein [Metapseudomonas otitidis]|uniref:hypothetical protein n=1 Tax=Metapseudomonas otitidis TaxID=319939 RepID=UPI0013F69708|nr:hypothetical protein [Pseudomonas otitidis]